MQAITAGQQAPPAEGTQIDFAFQGTVRGARIGGSVAGVDYAHARADGRSEVRIKGYAA